MAACVYLAESERIMGGYRRRSWRYGAHSARFAVAAHGLGQIQRSAKIAADRAIALHRATGAATGCGAVARNPDRGVTVAALVRFARKQKLEKTGSSAP
jgi:hypothetical protein